MSLTTVTPTKTDIIALDVGTTNIKCAIFDQNYRVLTLKTTPLSIVRPKPEFQEIEPEQLWSTIKKLINKCLNAPNIDKQRVKSLGISTHRCSIISWHRTTGKSFHNFLMWNDRRSREIIETANNSYLLRAFRGICWALHFLTGNKRYLAASSYQVTDGQVIGRIMWAIQNIPELSEAIKLDMVKFGTLDTWLIDKLTNGQSYFVDVSNASGTGLFDPFEQSWLSTAGILFNIPLHLFPAIVCNDHDFGSVSKDHLDIDFDIPIRACMADQSASAFGLKCLNTGDIKVTMGTGTFVDMVTGSDIYPCVSQIYPLTGWRINNQLIFLVEGASYTCGCLIDRIIFDMTSSCREIEEITANARYFDDTLYFIDRSLTNENFDCVGKTLQTSQESCIVAIIESIVFETHVILNHIKTKTNVDFQTLKIDGGVSKCNFICQSLADISACNVVRYQTYNTPLLGVAGVANNDADSNWLTVDCQFHPNELNGQRLQRKFSNWSQLVRS